MPTTYLLALRVGGGAAGSLGWYWSLPQRARQATDARARAHIERTYGTAMRDLSVAQARDAYDWARVRHAHDRVRAWQT